MLNEKEIKDYFLLVNSHAKKELGQNFLIDEKVSLEIANSLELKETDSLLEIGPGLGALTCNLIGKTNNYTVVEYDEKFVKFLTMSYGNQNIEIVKNNILKYKDFSFNKITGNLPYYISTDILEFILTKFPNLEIGVFMTQKEFFERITTKNKRDKGPINYLIEYLYNINKILVVPYTSFFPMPTVASIVFKVERKQEKEFSFAMFLYKIASILFINRRKNIANNLKSVLKNEEINLVLEETNISKNLRAEDLTLENLVNLTNVILKLKNRNL